MKHTIIGFFILASLSAFGQERLGKEHYERLAQEAADAANAVFADRMYELTHPDINFGLERAEVQTCTLKVKKTFSSKDFTSEVRLPRATDKLYSHLFAVSTRKGDILIKIEQDGNSLYYKLTAEGNDEVLKYFGLEAAPQISLTPGPMYDDGEEHVLTNSKRFTLSCKITQK